MLSCSSLLPLTYSTSGCRAKFIEIFKESRPTVLAWDCCYKQPFHFIAGSVSGVQRSRTHLHFHLPHAQPSHPNNWIVPHSRHLEGTRLVLEVGRSSSVIPSKSSHPVPNWTSMLKSHNTGNKGASGYESAPTCLMRNCTLYDSVCLPLCQDSRALAPPPTHSYTSLCFQWQTEWLNMSGNSRVSRFSTKVKLLSPVILKRMLLKPRGKEDTHLPLVDLHDTINSTKE